MMIAYKTKMDSYCIFLGDESRLYLWYGTNIRQYGITDRPVESLIQVKIRPGLKACWLLNGGHL